VENAPLGIESAKRAGLFCIAITTGLPREYLKEADIIVKRLEDITASIEKTCSGQ
jgi:beta-phosphoglucomutase-like phosphatase (HAD superfamily)